MEAPRRGAGFSLFGVLGGGAAVTSSPDPILTFATIPKHREIVQYPKRGGRACQGPLHEVKGCNPQLCEKPQDCVWGDWGAWGACSKDCGYGERNRFRHIITDGRIVDITTPLPDNWQLPGWRVSEYSERILTRELVESMGLTT